jgi:hypothetical protein
MDDPPTVPELMGRYGLSDKDCEKKISSPHLEHISRSCCMEWKSLPPHLKLETIVAEDIDKKSATEKAKRYDFLLKWKEMKGAQATYKQLLAALLEIKCTQDSEKVCEMLKQPRPAEPIAKHGTSTTLGKYRGTQGNCHTYSKYRMRNLMWVQVGKCITQILSSKELRQNNKLAVLFPDCNTVSLPAR